MDLEYANEFLVLATTLNYSRAAEKLYISQPSLSRHIRLLEKELGFPLVKTSSHGVSLTPAGEEAVAVFRKMLNEFDGFCTRERQRSMQLSGSLSVGLLYYSIEDYFSDFIPDFKNRYPKIKLDVISYQPHQLYEDLLNGRIDVGQILAINPKDDLLQYQKIGEDRMNAVMKSSHPLAKKKSVALKELQKETLIELSEDDFSAELTRDILAANKIHFKKTIQTETIETVPYTIRKTGGVHLTGGSVRKQGGKEMAYVPISDQRAYSNIYLACLKNNDKELTSLFLREAKLFFTS